MKFLVSDWMISMGVVALKRFDKKNVIQVQGNMVDVPLSYFDDFHERFFNVLYDDHRGSELQKNRLVRHIDYLIDKKQWGKEEKKLIKDVFAKAKISKVLNPDTQVEEMELVERITTETDTAFKEKNALKLELVKQDIITYFDTPAVRAYYDLTLVRSGILNRDTFGQVSFLNTSLYTLKIDEVKEVFKKDFIDEVVWEWQLHEAIQKHDDFEAKSLLHDVFVNKKTKNNKYALAQAYKDDHKKRKFDIWEEDLDWDWFNSYEQCSLLMNQWATMPYEEKVFVPLGSTSMNDRWNLDSESGQYISCFARLLLFIAPLGCTTYRKGEDTTFSFFHIEGDCSRTIRENARFRRAVQKGSTVEDSIVSSLELTQKKMQKAVNDTILIEFVSYGAQSKKTALHYTMLDSFVAGILGGTGVYKIFWHNIMPYSTRNDVVSRMLHNEPVLPIAKKAILQALKKERELRHKELLTIYEIIKLNNLLLQRGGNDVSNYASIGYQVRKDAEKVTQIFKHKKLDKRLDATVYKMLKAIQTRNRGMFVNLAIRTYMTAGMAINLNISLLADIARFSDKEFEGIAYAFASGLLSNKPSVYSTLKDDNDHDNEQLVDKEVAQEAVEEQVKQEATEKAVEEQPKSEQTTLFLDDDSTTTETK